VILQFLPILQVIISILLNAIQLLMLFARTLEYLEPKFYFYIVFHNGNFLLINILTVFTLGVFVFSRRIMFGAIALFGFLLMSKQQVALFSPCGLWIYVSHFAPLLAYACLIIGCGLLSELANTGSIELTLYVRRYTCLFHLQMCKLCMSVRK
jgi:hypothetical protein